MIVAAFPEQSMVHNVVYIKLIKERIAVLSRVVNKDDISLAWDRDHTLETEAVKTTTSYNSPTRFMNWSTPGLLMT